jgi:NAD(P)-dependent dehydrogenase (short-subunit alcohol dehydrogenase family)
MGCGNGIGNQHQPAVRMTQNRNASVAVIGAGDYIGAAIARKFAAEGFIVFAGRRNGEKLVPLVAEIEGAGGRAFGRTLDARESGVAYFSCRK